VRDGGTGRLTRLLANPWLRAAAIGVPLVVSLVNLARVPSVALLPLVPALALYVVGKYVLCPLRWHALTGGGLSRRWHLRAYAEGELLGLAAPAHVAADLWRANRLMRAGLTAGHTARAVALDRGVGAVGLGLAGAAVGVSLPSRVLAAVAVAAVVAVTVAWCLRARRRWLRAAAAELDRRAAAAEPDRRAAAAEPDRAAGHSGPSRPGWRTLGYGLGLSVLYQATAAAFLLGVVVAVHEPVSPVRLAAIYAASQIAGVIPGWSGLSARDGALAASLTTLGLSWPAALGSVARAAVIAWIPALMLGGTSLLVCWLAALRVRLRRTS
jgi:hypothetical protein